MTGPPVTFEEKVAALRSLCEAQPEAVETWALDSFVEALAEPPGAVAPGRWEMIAEAVLLIGRIRSRSRGEVVRVDFESRRPVPEPGS